MSTKHANTESFADGRAITRVTSLTGANIWALVQAQQAGRLPAGTRITKTTASFPVGPKTALDALFTAKAHFTQQHGTSRNTTTNSLNAVVRKVEGLLS